MHVLVAAHDFYPDPGSGGTGRYVHETARRLVDRGHRVSVVTRRRGDVPCREVVAGVAVRRYDFEVADRAAPAVLRQLPGARRAVATHVGELTAEEPVDLLSPQGTVTPLLVGGAVDADVPRVPTVHSPWPVEYRIRTRGERSGPRLVANAATRHALERYALSRAARTVTLSGYMRDVLADRYGAGLDVSVVPGGVDADRFSPAARPADGLDGDPAFLTVRRLAARMGHDLLLAAFAEVAAAHPAARLYVAGDGPLRERLRERAEALGVADRTTFLGYVPDEGLPGLYAAADVFVLPTRELEGFGLATLEALASGTPVVATPVGGTVEVLSGLADDPAVPEPVLADAADADALADRLLAWAGRSAGDLAAAGRASRRHARERFPWSRTVDGLESVYGSVRR